MCVRRDCAAGRSRAACVCARCASEMEGEPDGNLHVTTSNPIETKSVKRAGSNEQRLCCTYTQGCSTQRRIVVHRAPPSRVSS